MPNISKSNRKKIIIVSGVGALLCSFAAAGISAYFTDGDTTTNTFTIGKVELDLLEPAWTDTATDLVPRHELSKDPKIKNTGINPEYVFMTVDVPVFSNKTLINDKTGVRSENRNGEVFSYEVGGTYYDTLLDALAHNADWTVLRVEDLTFGDDGYITAPQSVQNNPDADALEECILWATDAESSQKNIGYVRYTIAYGTGNQKANLKKLERGDETGTIFNKVRVKNFREDEEFELNDAFESVLDEDYTYIKLNAYGIQSEWIDDYATSAMDIFNIIKNQNPSKVKFNEHEKTDEVIVPTPTPGP